MWASGNPNNSIIPPRRRRGTRESAKIGEPWELGKPANPEGSGVGEPGALGVLWKCGAREHVGKQLVVGRPWDPSKIGEPGELGKLGKQEKLGKLGPPAEPGGVGKLGKREDLGGGWISVG